MNALCISFFVFGTFFPTIRLLLLGSQGSTNAFQFLFSALPELFFLVFLTLGFRLILKNGIPKFSGLDYALLIYVCYNLIVGFYLANDLKLSIYATRMTYFPMGMYFVFSWINQEQLDLELLVARIFRFFTWIAGIGIVLYFVFPNIQNYFLKLNSPLIAEYFIIRMTSVFWTPVVFGVFVSSSILYAFYAYLKTHQTKFLAHLTILFICLFMSVSRGSMIVETIGILLLAAFAKNWKKLVHVLVLKIVVFLAVSFYISNPVEFFDWILTSTSETAGLKSGVTRVELWMQSFETVKSHPFGLGLGKAGHVATRFLSDSNLENVSIASTDGWFLKLMLETGFLGVLLYILVALYLSILVIKFMLNNSFGFMSFAWVLFIIVNIQNLVSNVLDFQLFTFLFWMIVGIMSLKLKQEKHVGN